jgi:hypothetical protein
MERSACLALILVAALVAASACGPQPASAKHPSWITRSYYMADGGGARARNLGCANGDKQGRMTLFFGAPTVVAGTYGVTLWGAPNRTTAQVAATVKEVVRGYAECRRDPSYRLLIGVGTSNSAIDGKSADWVIRHGQAWGTIVRNLAGWAAAHYPGHVRMYGAWDAEPSWASFEKTNLWMHGYDDVPNVPALHTHNSADGCPRSSSNNGSCNNGWTQYRLWHVSWEHAPALPMPQIYATSGVNAKQWHMLDAYGFRNRGRGMTFYGVMSQHEACARAGGCPGTDATPSQSHDFLLRELWTRDYTRQASLPGMTNIRWHS